MPAVDERIALKAFDQRTRDRPRPGGVDVYEQHRELVAAEPGDDVDRAQAVAHHRPDVLDHLIADLVAERIVDELEVVEIQHQERRALGS